METLESLISKNTNYHRRYGVTKSDLDKVNSLIELIEGTRLSSRPVEGDIIQCHGPKKKYLNGHMDRGLEDTWSQICVQPSVPFTYYSETTKMPRFSTSGGYWTACPELEMYEYIGKRKKFFCEFGHCGPCAGGAVHFEAEVNEWKLFMEEIY